MFDSHNHVAKKSLGQNFLHDYDIIHRITQSIKNIYQNEQAVIEIGPGLGAITKELFNIFGTKLHLIEFDHDLHSRLCSSFNHISSQIYLCDVLKFDFSTIPSTKSILVGNLPYNISSPILFKVLAERDRISGTVFMLQHEVAARISSGPGTKDYGIPTVLLKAFFDIDYLFSVPATCFSPVPKVLSAVVSMRRNNVTKLQCKESTFFHVVKQAFAHRRKTIRNSLKGIISPDYDSCILEARPESLGLQQFLDIAQSVDGL